MKYYFKKVLPAIKGFTKADLQQYAKCINELHLKRNLHLIKS